MARTDRQGRTVLALFLGGTLAALVAGLWVASAGAESAATVVCPLTASEVSATVGRTVQRVNLSDDDGDVTDQCAFSAISRSTGLKRSPQVFLNVDPGGIGDLRDLYAYYVGARSRLATHPRVTMRPDLGNGAFTLSATTAPVTSAFFLVGKAGVGTLTVDLGGAPLALRDSGTADEIFMLVHGRLH
jgi:hypothetical protein